MAPLLKRLLGNGTNDREVVEEMRAVLNELQQERHRCEMLMESTRNGADRLKQLDEPIANAGTAISEVSQRMKELEDRFAAMVHLSTQFHALGERAELLGHDQLQAKTRIAEALEEVERIRSVFGDVSQKVDLAMGLKDRLSTFLEVEKPFQQLRDEANSLRGQVDGTADGVVRLREQHDRMLDQHKLALTKMEALDRRRDDLGRSMQDKERRVESVEQGLREMDGVQQTIDDVRREMGALKAMADLVGQKTAALEAQRDSVDRALAQAEHLDRAMRQIDAGMRQQQENEKSLKLLQEAMSGARALHEEVVERSGAVSQMQRDIDARIQANRQDLAAVTDEAKKTIERFDFERRGIETVTQRVADLRAAVSDCESRFKALNGPSQAVGELVTQTQALGERMQSLSSEAASVDAELAKWHGMRRDLEETGRTAREVSAHVTQIEQTRPSLEAALRDLGQLSSAHAMTKDALEQMQVAHGEITRVRESQSATRTWLTDVERDVAHLGEQVGMLRDLAPTIDFVQKQTQRIDQSMAAIEARRDFVEDLNRRMTDIEALGGQLDDRDRQLSQRMGAAEQRFVGLAAQAEEAERMTMTVASVASNLQQVGREAGEIKKSVTAIAARAESVEELAEQSKALRKELEQRQHAVAEATKELKRAASLRQEAAASAQQLDEIAKHLGATLAATDQRVTRADELATELESRTSSLQSIEERLGKFEARIAKWDLIDQDITRSLEQIAARQGTVEALQADLDRMFSMAEKTITHVREITSSHQQIEESRDLLNEVTSRLQEVRDTASALDERKRQMTKAEERLARADGLLTNVRSSIETLQGQKAVVDQAVEKAAALQFLLKKAEAAIEGLREERKTTKLVRSANAGAKRQDDVDNDEDLAQAA
jgi:chromosome segregation ATPase